MRAFIDLGVWRWIVGNCILFIMSFGWVISHKVSESYAWSKLSWLFLQNPNLATFKSWWILSNPWWIMINPWSNDELYLKMRMLTKNLEVWLYVGHSWLLTQHSRFLGLLSNLLTKVSLQGLKFVMDELKNILGHWGTLEVIWMWRPWCNTKP